eukprot:PRCOL_00005382-RA
MWIAVDGHVMDVSKFARLHPGGAQALEAVAGTECSAEFYALHRSEVLTKYLPRLKIGVLEGATPPAKLPPGAAPPYCAEPASRKGWSSPYYNASHHAFRAACREFVERELAPVAAQMEAEGKEPAGEINRKMGEAGILAARLGPGEHLRGWALPGGVKPEEFDYFHELIISEEFCRLGCPALGDGLAGGLTIGLPPVVNFAPPALRDEVVPRVLSGERRIALAISDAYAGSDAAQITATATKTPCGRFYEVSGTKKWITNGTSAHYFVTAVRTGGQGAMGVSLLLIERDDNVSTKLMQTRYGGAAGTAFVTFDKVRVPVANLLGQENLGFMCIMVNFNHERWAMCVGIVGYSRKVLEECLRWAAVRKTFGKPLLSQPVIRSRLASMAAEVEACHAWVESLTYQMCTMDPRTSHKQLGGPIALCKAKCSRAMAHVCDYAAQVFGGRAITKTGMGAVVERIARYQKFGAILGGSEEILDDLAMRQAIKGSTGRA